MYKTRCRVVEDHQGHRAHRCRIQSSRRSRRRPPPHAPGATHPIRKLAPKTHTGPSSSDFRAEAHHQHHPCTHTTHAARKAGGKGRARRGPVPAHPATAVVSRPGTRPNVGGTARTRPAIPLSRALHTIYSLFWPMYTHTRVGGHRPYYTDMM